MQGRPSQIHPHQAIAVCTREQAGQLVNYDHHTVRVRDQLGVMLTYGWMPVDEHAEKHPRAPELIQDIVDTLHFHLRGQPR